MNKKLMGLGIVLAIVGIICVAATVYQELVEEPKPEDYHMGIPTARYEWRSRNLAITVAGIGLFVCGLVFGLAGVRWKS